ncbi:cation efflux system protein czcD [Pyricularia oryzae 70-15]|uniref:Cation efflux system protein czcD n=1 Tax=Pyricularia oryzae (strain 70-15 / ATCC MYA-4617 / FGSC 8958) TaxID=242507 RepID=G4NIP6_PYRO7|nr:cation efflux system protein czcD [Pyricularia oryzae 70-15]EHA47302.1 cation efflux system protein czcD [Pyricularia oryzae 70-15]
MVFHISRKSRIIIAISISALFFIAELYVAFRTRSLALMADAFHYINDVVSFVIGLVAIMLSERKETPPEMLSFGWQRATILGSFFNGVFLLALGLSIFLQSIERFVSLELFADDGDVQNIMIIPVDILTVTHTASNMNMQTNQSRTIHGTLWMHMLNMLNIGTTSKLPWPRVMPMILTSSEARFYADPAISTFIAIMIFVTAVPLVRKSGEILLQSVPVGLSPSDVTHDLEKIPGVDSVHHLHIWRLDQTKTVASVHVVVQDEAISDFMTKARTVTECLHAYGIHTAIIQPEVAFHQGPALPAVISDEDQASIGISTLIPASSSSSSRTNTGQRGTRCQMPCSSLCEDLRCCT